MPNYLTFPANLRSGIRRYIEDGTNPGSFLTSVIHNDLMGAFSNADEENCFKMFSIVKWMYNQAPKNCWGSAEKMLRWIEIKTEGGEA